MAEKKQKKTTKKKSKATKKSDKQKLLKDLTGQLLKHLEIDAKVSVSKDTGPEDTTLYQVELEGEDLGILIGYHGETLSAIQLFLNMALYRQCGEWSQVLVDIGGYRKEQEERLKSIAAKIADRARFEARPVEMRPMPAFERRVIHLEVAKMDDIESESVGEGRERRIIIKPK